MRDDTNDRDNNSRRISPIKANRRNVLALGGSSLVAGLAGCLGLGGDGGNSGDDSGSDFPSETIRVIIAFGEGGGTDIYARQIWNQVREMRDVSTQFDNISGAAGIQGGTEFVNSEPDGHTITPYNVPGDIIPAMIQQPDYSFDNFRGIAGHAVAPFVLIANPDTGVEGFEEMKSRYNNGDFQGFGGMPRGSQFNVVATILRDNEEFNVQWENYIPYDGSGGIGQAVASGEVPAGIVTLSTAEDISDQINVVAGLVDQELEPFPDADILPELGYPSLDFIGKITRVTYAPPETPDERVEWLDSASEEAITSDALQSWANESGLHLEYMGGSDYVEQLTEDAITRIKENVDLEQFR